MSKKLLLCFVAVAVADFLMLIIQSKSRLIMKRFFKKGYGSRIKPDWVNSYLLFSLYSFPAKNPHSSNYLKEIDNLYWNS